MNTHTHTYMYNRFIYILNIMYINIFSDLFLSTYMRNYINYFLLLGKKTISLDYPETVFWANIVYNLFCKIKF